jgi:chemotaxis protein methyltransferase CheR
MSAVTRDDYLIFCDGLRQLCGIDLTQYKRPQMERRLRAFFARRGMVNLSESLPTLRRDPAELDALLDRVTINVSQLWRHPDQWARLQEHILPELAGAGRTIRAWSAGCSYGAEAFTMAATCRQAIPSAIVRVVGTDIDARVIARAREAVFTDEDARGVPNHLMTRFYDRSGNGWRAKPELRAMVRFEAADLLRLDPGVGTYDLIMCRNTVIYFAESIRDALHGRLARALRPGGYLVIGPTERVASSREIGLEPVHPFILRRRNGHL